MVILLPFSMSLLAASMLALASRFRSVSMSRSFACRDIREGLLNIGVAAEIFLAVHPGENLFLPAQKIPTDGTSNKLDKRSR